jgi:two-component system sensor histidine kinase BaeS
MTARRNRRFLGIGQLGRRLIVAFVAVALAAVAADVAVTVATGGGDVRRLASSQETDLTGAAARAARLAYLGHGHWDRARLAPFLRFVEETNAVVRIRGSSGTVVAASPGFAEVPANPQLSAPIRAGRAQIGSVTLRFHGNALATAVMRLDAARWAARLWAAAIAALLALAVSVVAARRISAPLDRMLAAMRARGAGNREIRIANTRSVGVLRELLEGFNRTTDAMDRRDLEQRNLVASLAHELRTPVAVLQAGHEAMLDGLTEPTPENLGSLRDEVLRLSRTLEDLSALTAAQAASLQLRLFPHDLAALTASATMSLQEAFDMADLTLRSRLTAAVARCDYDRIREVVVNLLTNAMKYTPAGGTVLIETGQGDDGQARVLVTDTGIGIPPDELPHVTERFFRGRRPACLAAGSGLGLTIVAELVRAHHGALDITSEPGAGTLVTVTLPAAPAPSPGDERDHPPEPAHEHARTRADPADAPR